MFLLVDLNRLIVPVQQARGARRDRLYKTTIIFTRLLPFGYSALRHRTAYREFQLETKRKKKKTL